MSIHKHPSLQSLALLAFGLFLAACPSSSKTFTLSIEPTVSTVPVGMKVNVAALLDEGTGPKPLPQGATVTWISSAPAIADVQAGKDGSAVVTGVSFGTATLTATAGSLTATARVFVTDTSLVSITVSPASTSVVKGTTRQLTATGTFSDQQTMDLTDQVNWTTSDSNIAAVTNTPSPAGAGLVTGVNVGSAEITATLGAASAKSTVTVTIPTLESLAISPANQQLAVGLKQQYTALGFFSDFTIQDLSTQVTWASSDTSVADISNLQGSQGLASGLNAGTVSISASFMGKTASTQLAVSSKTLVSIAVSPINIKLPVGLKLQYAAVASFSDGTTQDITAQAAWTSSNSNIATVGNLAGTQGLASGLAVGSTTITAALNGKSGTATLDVIAATIVSISITPPNTSLVVNATQQYTATAIFSNGSNQDVTSQVTWSSTDATVADVNDAAGSKGLATAHKMGSVTISATLMGQSGSTALFVSSAVVSSIAVTPTNATIAKGLTQQYAAIATLSDGTLADVTAQAIWSSSASATASISNTAGSKGLAQGILKGTTTISANFSGQISSTLLTVSDATIASIAVTPSNGTLPKGLSQQYTAIATLSDGTTSNITTTATWRSSDATIVNVSNAAGSIGLALGTGVGTATIFADLSGKTGSTVLFVSSATISSIAVTPGNVSVAAGLKQQYTAIATLSDGSSVDVTTQVTWASSNSTAATISSAAGSKGLATASNSGTGTTTISASLSGQSGSTSLTCTAATIVSIAVTASPTPPGPIPIIAKGLTQQFIATATMSDQNTSDITATATWTSSVDTVATISNAAGSNGLATGIRAGSTIITAAFNGKNGTLGLSVTNAAVQSITVTPANVSIAAGVMQQYTAIANLSDSTTSDVTSQVTWATSNAVIASISNANGSRGLAKGEATNASPVNITATLNGVTGSTALTVTSKTLVSIALTPPNPSLPLGLTQQFMATGTFSDNTTADLTMQATWASSDVSKATISNAAGSNGMASSVALGSTTIFAAFGGKTGSTLLTVSAATVVSINVTPTNPSVAAGLKQQFAAVGTFTDGSTKDITDQVTWGTSDPTKATISNASGSNGLATTLVAGTITIDAQLGGKTGTTQLVITTATLVSIAVTPPAISLALGLKQQYMATGTFTDGTNKDLTTQVSWSTSNSAIADISNAAGSIGFASSVAVGGPVNITATSGAISGTTKLTITSATLASIQVTPPNVSIAKGLTQQYTATGILTDGTSQTITDQVTWGTSDGTVATISNAAGSHGLATSAGVGGPIDVTASLSGITGGTKLTVSAATLVSISVTPGISSLADGLTLQYTATGTFTDNSTKDITTQVVWSSSNSSFAAISNAAGSEGLATGVDPGAAVITATLGAVIGNAKLTITNATLVSISLTPPNISVPLGVKPQYAATGTFTDSSTQDITTQVTWTSSNTGVATISSAAGSEGLASTVSTGSTTITATLSGKSGTTGLTVTAAVLFSIAVNPTNTSLPVGLTQQFTAIAIFTDSTTQPVTTQAVWSSSDTSKASISNAAGSIGLASGLAVGPTTIAATFGGKTGSTLLMVSSAVVVSIAVSPTNPTLPVGVKQQFTAIGTFSDGSVKNVTTQVVWASNNGSATISNAPGSEGLATGASAGSTNIFAGIGAVSGTTILTVNTATITGLVVSPPSPSIPLGLNQQFTATGTFSDGSARDLTKQATWSSSSTSTATVSNAANSQGLASSVAVGNTNISVTFTAAGTAISSTVLTVTSASLTSLVVTPTNPSIAKGLNKQFTATGTFTDNSNKDVTDQVTWSSSNGSIASVSNASGSQGLANGVEVGSAIITATSGMISGSSVLTVSAATLASIAVTPATASIAKGTTQQYTAIGTLTDGSTSNLTDQVTWSTGDSSKVAISNAAGSQGLATGLDIVSGLSVTAALSGKSGSTTVSVTAATLVSIAVTPATPSIAKGTKLQFVATGTFTDASTQNITTQVTWATTDSSIVDISNVAGSLGLATAQAAGSVTITATASGVSGSTSMTVTNATLVSIAVSPSSTTIAVGAKVQYTAVGTFSDSTQQDLTAQVTWASADTSLAAISNANGSHGLATGLATGSVFISAVIDLGGGAVSSAGTLNITP